MPASYDIKGQVVYLNLVGDYGMPDIEQSFAAAIGDADFPVGAQMLMDITRSTSIGDRSADDVRYMANHLASISSHFGQRLGIAAGNKFHYGMMRMAEVYSEASGMQVRAFIELGDAEEWLLSGDADN